MPYPMPYTPWTGGRIAGVAGGIMTIIDAVLALMLGAVMVAEWEYALGTYLIVASSLAIVGAVTVFLARVPYLGIVGPVMLIIGGIWVIVYIWWFGIIVGAIGIILAVIGLVLVLVGWRDLMQRADLRYQMIQPAFAPPGMQPGAQPPSDYGNGPGGPRF